MTLTADVSGITDANGLTGVSYSYQWIANNGTADTDLQDATASAYTPSVSDVGKTIKVKVSFTDDANNDESLTSVATTAVAATVPTAPLSLTVATGDQIQELDASWQAPSSNGGSAVTGYKVQWKEAADSWDTAADVSEAAETGTTHTITGLTGGVEYAVRVIATNDVGDGPASTEAKGTPAGGVSEQTTETENSAPTGLPGISGTPQVDQTLTADTSPIDDADGLTNVSYRYQWIAGGSDIDGATGSSYTLTTSEQGQTIPGAGDLHRRPEQRRDPDQHCYCRSGGGTGAAHRPAEGRRPGLPRRLVGVHLRNRVQRGVWRELRDPEVPRLQCNGRIRGEGAKNGQAQQHSLAHHGKAARHRGRDHRTPGNHGLRSYRGDLHR